MALTHLSSVNSQLHFRGVVDGGAIHVSDQITRLDASLGCGAVFHDFNDEHAVELGHGAKVARGVDFLGQLGRQAL